MPCPIDLEINRFRDTPRSQPKMEFKDTNDVISVGTGEPPEKEEDNNEEDQNQTGDEVSDDAETIEYGHSESEVDDISPDATGSSPQMSDVEDDQTDCEEPSLADDDTLSSDDEHIVSEVCKSFDYQENVSSQFVKIYSGMCTVS